ncbi:UNVERIFIED_CONTAM: hypothetical protein O8I53_09420 [Campylobacter lari]
MIFDAVVENLNFKSTDQSTLFGAVYIISFQFLGTLAGFLTFLGYFYSFRKLQNDYFENNKKITLKDILFSNHNENSIAFGFKEALFILLFTITIAMSSRISISYGLGHFEFLLINMLFLLTILMLSSFFNFYAFHIFIATGFAILNLIVYCKEKRTVLKINLHYFLDLALTILIPFLIGLGTILIIKQGGLKYAY